MNGVMTRVLAVESDAPIRQLLKVTLASASFDVKTAASAEEADCIADLGTGPDDYITKPFKPSELIESVRGVGYRYSGKIA